MADRTASLSLSFHPLLSVFGFLLRPIRICSTINIYTVQDKVKIRMSQILNILKWKHIKDTSKSRNKVVFITQSILVAATEIQRKHNLNVFLLILLLTSLKLWTFSIFYLLIYFYYLLNILRKKRILDVLKTTATHFGLSHWLL